MTYIILDANNLFHRTKHVVRGDADTKGAMAVHMCFNIIRKAWNMFDGKHIVVALEGGGRRNWRREKYSPYKASRVTARNMRSAREQEDDEIFFEYINDFTRYLKEDTNVSVIQAIGAEADDVIAHWIGLHPDNHHVICSNDSDFYQLLAPNVTIYRGQVQEIVTLDKVTDEDGKDIIDKKTGKPKLAPNPEWELFKKIMVGDPGDGVERAALPRTRETKLREAFEDRNGKGFAWNNIMLQEWENPEGESMKVIDRYKRNQRLIDLTQQPDDIKTELNRAILEVTDAEPIPAAKIGFKFMKFCDSIDLKKIGENPEPYTHILKATYSGE